MTKEYGYKNGESVTHAVVRMLLDGELRTGDRIDRNELAARLGVSRSPIQEALVHLERDGLVSTTYHRGAFVERFDADAIREHYLVWGLLNGEAAARLAERSDPATLATLGGLVDRMRATRDPDEFDAAGFEYRKVVNDAVAGPRLRALFKSFLSFMPEAFRLMWPKHVKVILPFYEAETEAIARGDPDAARRAEADKSKVMAELVIAALVRRKVFARDTVRPLNTVRSAGSDAAPVKGG